MDIHVMIQLYDLVYEEELVTVLFVMVLIVRVVVLFGVQIRVQPKACDQLAWLVLILTVIMPVNLINEGELEMLMKICDGIDQTAEAHDDLVPLMMLTIDDLVPR